MALKIVHLCDVHSAKGEDIPATFAHTIGVDGGTFAVDLCPQCDAERFLPLVGFLEAFGLLTDGAVDPRPAIAENLRTLYAQQSGASLPPAAVPAPAPAAAPVRAQQPEPRPIAPRPPSKPVQGRSEPAEEELLPAGRVVYPETAARLPALRTLLLGNPDGLSVREIQQRMQLTAGAATNALGLLKEAGHAEYLGQRWHAPENVPEDVRERFAAQREIVAARNSVPRVCPVDGEQFSGTSQWADHCTRAHGVSPAEFFGLVCPLDAEEFSAPQVLGMHGRREHDAVHTPQLFQLAAEAGDPVGLVADIRKRFGA